GPGSGRHTLAPDRIDSRKSGRVLMRTRMIGMLAGATAAAAVLAGPAVAGATTAAAAAAGHQLGGAAVRRHQVAIARQATRKFHSIATAKKDGDARFKDTSGMACIAMPPAGARAP